MNWKYDRTPVAASIADRNDNGFKLVLSFTTKEESMDAVIGFVATSLRNNGIRYWDDDNTISDLNHNDGCMMVFSVSGSPMTQSELAKKVSVTIHGDLFRVSIPCGAN
jgi:hypothetical protein